SRFLRGAPARAKLRSGHRVARWIRSGPIGQALDVHGFLFGQTDARAAIASIGGGLLSADIDDPPVPPAVPRPVGIALAERRVDVDVREPWIPRELAGREVRLDGVQRLLERQL